MSPDRVHNIEDLRRAARARLPRIAYGYLEGGAEDELTLRANREVFNSIRFAPRMFIDVSARSQQVTVLGRKYDCPFGIAPTGAAGILWHDADIALARAAREANVPFALSTHSLAPLERVTCEARYAPWFQLYMSKDRAATERAVTRAIAAGSEALLLTADVPVGGNREYNERNGFTMPLRLGVRTVLDGLAHPRWLLGVYLRSRLPNDLPHWGERRDSVDWSDVAWLRTLWPRSLVVKGILRIEDAKLALEHGADGIVISNHGGRQLDGAPSPLEVLPQIAHAVGEHLTIMVDSGFRRGTDIVKALALGADMVLVGRAALYGVAAAGEAGVRRALDILKNEVDRVMALIGCRSVAELDASFVRLPRSEVRRPAPQALRALHRAA